MRQELIKLADTYQRAGDAIHDAIRENLRQVGGFLNCSNNKRDKQDMFAQVYDSKKKHSQAFPIRAMRLDPQDRVEIYIGTADTVYTENYLRGRLSEEHWQLLKDSAILFQPTILSIAAAIDDYLAELS